MILAEDLQLVWVRTVLALCAFHLRLRALPAAAWAATPLELMAAVDTSAELLRTHGSFPSRLEELCTAFILGAVYQPLEPRQVVVSLWEATVVQSLRTGAISLGEQLAVSLPELLARMGVEFSA
jgi:hypothetical protein